MQGRCTKFEEPCTDQRRSAAELSLRLALLPLRGPDALRSPPSCRQCPLCGGELPQGGRRLQPGSGARSRRCHPVQVLLTIAASGPAGGHFTQAAPHKPVKPELAWPAPCGLEVWLHRLAHFPGSQAGTAPPACSNRAACHLKLDQADQALVDAERASRLRPEWPKGHFRRGCALEALGRLDEVGEGPSPADQSSGRAALGTACWAGAMRIAPCTLLAGQCLRTCWHAAQRLQAAAAFSAALEAGGDGREVRERLKDLRRRLSGRRQAEASVSGCHGTQAAQTVGELAKNDTQEAGQYWRHAAAGWQVRFRPHQGLPLLLATNNAGCCRAGRPRRSGPLPPAAREGWPRTGQRRRRGAHPARGSRRLGPGFEPGRAIRMVRCPAAATALQRCALTSGGAFKLNCTPADGEEGMRSSG